MLGFSCSISVSLASAMNIPSDPDFSFPSSLGFFDEMFCQQDDSLSDLSSVHAGSNDDTEDHLERFRRGSNSDSQGGFTSSPSMVHLPVDETEVSVYSAPYHLCFVPNSQSQSQIHYVQLSAHGAAGSLNMGRL